MIGSALLSYAIETLLLYILAGILVIWGMTYAPTVIESLQQTMIRTVEQKYTPSL